MMTAPPIATPTAADRVRPAEQLIVLPLFLRVADGRVLYDLQSRASLDRYLDHFESLILAMPRLSESRAAEFSARKNFVWVPVDDLADRVQFVPLPEPTSVSAFLRDYRPTARLLRRCIDAAKYVQCAPSGVVGDWGAVAAGEALRAGRKYALLTDAVTYKSLAMMAREPGSPARRAKRSAIAWVGRAWHRRLVRRCDLIFCNGAETYQEFAPLCKAPGVAHKINDFQIESDKYLDEDSAERKRRDALARSDLRICYAGRVEPNKAPLQWARAIARARSLGADVRGSWLGAGSAYDEFRRELTRLGLDGVVEAPGFVADRGRVIRQIREADVMPFTHIDPESPRVLIESLMSATPIVGYDRPHPRDLISGHGGGRITPLGDPDALGDALAALAADREGLADLIGRAWRDGARFNSDILARDRSALIREHLG